MRVRAAILAAAVTVLATAAPGASAQTGITGIEASSTGLISDEGFVTLGTTLECPVATGGATVSATLEQQHSGGTSSAFAFGGRDVLDSFCDPGGSPMALAFGSSDPPFTRGPADVSMEGCAGGGCLSTEQTVQLRDGGRTVDASVPAGSQSLSQFGVSSRAVLESSGVVTLGTVVDCSSVSGPSFSGTLEQGKGKKLAEATTSAFILGGCGGSGPVALSFTPNAGSPAFDPRHARLSLTVCAGPAGDFDCATVDTRLKLISAG
ncbi:MAG TPA: hypothetical protein VF072_02960 [Thermoleophilaceae bacterium]